MQNKYITNPIESKKMFIMYHNIKIVPSAQQKAFEALRNLQKVLQQIEDRKK